MKNCLRPGEQAMDDMHHGLVDICPAGADEIRAAGQFTSVLTCSSGDILRDNHPACCLLNIDAIFRQNISRTASEIDEEGGLSIKITRCRNPQLLDA